MTDLVEETTDGLQTSDRWAKCRASSDDGHRQTFSDNRNPRCNFWCNFSDLLE